MGASSIKSVSAIGALRGTDLYANVAKDRLIAAHAVSTGIILVTNNEADFKDYPGLKVENWALNP